MSLARVLAIAKKHPKLYEQACGFYKAGNRLIDRCLARPDEVRLLKDVFIHRVMVFGFKIEALRKEECNVQQIKIRRDVKTNGHTKIYHFAVSQICPVTNQNG